MKHFMLPLVRDPNPNPFPFSELSNSTNPKPNFPKHKLNRKHKLPPRDKENSDLGTNADSVIGKPSPACKFRVPFTPKPPNPLKRKFSNDVVSDLISVGHCSSSSLDSGVKVLVRIRPLNKDEEDGELTVQKISNDSLSINGQTFTFDSVADTEATQLDVFEHVGAPLVENCLAGFNSSVFAYGQTGSGKTYTMWGPSNALLEGNLNDKQGLTPRVFERLFSHISEEQNKHADKQLRYQCRCSFLEIYNEQITDLLDPKQKNLQIREDVKSGIYVENLTEEHVSSLGDVMQLLLKGLSNRRTGTTSINAESSRSHSVFTCVVESHCKSASNGLSSFKTSRINLVDLAGSERQKLTGAAGKRLKEAGNINRSLSQLGNLINILAEISQTGKQRHIPYRDSKLTFLLQESLGGNAKLAMICAISPARRCKNETFSTLRFAQRAKAIKNKAVVNEVMQDDVNFLREVIQQLKDELLRMKAHGNQADPSAAYANSWNARRSINLLKFNLNQPNLMRHVDEDGDEVMEIDEEAVDRLCTEVGQQSTDSDVSHYADRTAKDCEHSVKQLLDSERNSPPKTSEIAHIEKQNVEVSDVSMEEEMSEIEKMKDQQNPTSKSNDIARMEEVLNEVPCKQIEDGSVPVPLSSDSVTNMNTETANDFPTDLSESVAPNLSIVPCDVSPALPSSTPSVSPRLVISSSRKSLRTSTTLTASQKNVQSCELGNQDAKASSTKFPHRRSQLDLTAFSSNSALSTTDQLAASCTLPSPTHSVSPTLVISSSRKSLRTSTMQTASQKNVQSCELRNQDAKASSAKFPQRSSQLALTAISRHTGLSTTDQLAASLHHGLEICNSHQQSSTLRKSAFGFSFKPADWKPLLPIKKVNVGIQTFPEATETPEDGMIYLCSNCKNQTLHKDSKEANDTSDLPLVPMEKSLSSEKPKKQVPKAVEKVLTGAIRREMALEDFCAKQTSEISQLNRLVQQYKHERECNAIIGQLREDKIIRLESLMDGVLPSEDFMELELASLHKEHELLKEKYENHPEVLRTKIELKRVQDELERLQNFFDMGERDVLVEEIHDLRNQLQYYIDNSQTNRKQKSLLKLTYAYEPSSASPLNAISELTEEDAMQKLERERSRWMEMESQLITRTEELKTELEASRRQSEQLKRELEKEKKCSGELKEALQLAMEGHARMLEQYADLEEKHMEMLTRQRMIQEEIGDVKKAAARAGVKGAESKFINALAAEISALKVEREKERQYMRDENRMLQAQLRDTAEAVQAAGELLVRLKEAEEAVSTAEKRAAEAEEKREKSRKQMEKLKKKHETEISKLKQLIAESNTVRHDTEEHHITCDERWKEEIKAFCGNGVDDELSSKFTDPSSWFSGYDRCNI